MLTSCVFYNHYVKTKYDKLLQDHQKFTATFNKKKMKKMKLH